MTNLQSFYVYAGTIQMLTGTGDVFHKPGLDQLGGDSESLPKITKSEIDGSSVTLSFGDGSQHTYGSNDAITCYVVR
ncbi:MAG: hypothetical protein QM658_07570 [Gordonia sp. (in: high G+C Gram-positive bacteria)]